MPFIQPGRSDVHVNTPLTNISLAFLQTQDAFVADRAFSVVPVAKQSDLYFTYDRGYFFRDQMQKRAPGAESAGSSYAIGTDSYRTDVWALHKDIADQVRSNADVPIQPDREATLFLTHQALVRKEKNWADNFFITGIWTNEETGVSGAPGANQFQIWNEAASTPISDVRDGIRTVQASTGRRPNRLILSRAVYDALVDHPDIIGRIDRGQTAGTALVLRANIAALFELEEILVMDSIETTSAEGATNVQAFIGGDNALLLYTPPSPGLMIPAAGYTFSWNGFLGAGALGTRIKRMRMEHLESDRVEIEMAYDHKLVSADLGFFFLTAII